MINALLLTAALSGPVLVPNSTELVLPGVVTFTVRWEGHGEQQILANCRTHAWAMISEEEIRDAEKHSEMYELINLACQEEWI